MGSVTAPAPAVAQARAWTVRFVLDRPVALGRWMLRDREYCVLELTTPAGHVAAAYTLTRGADVASELSGLLARPAEGVGPAGAAAPEPVSPGAAGSSAAARAAALVDACGWDLAAQARGVPLWRALADGDAVAPAAVHGVAVCGYPREGATGPDAVVAEVRAALDDGYAHVKLAALGGAEEVATTLERIRALDGDVGIVVDLEGALTTVAQVRERAVRWADLGLLWIEDPFGPERAELLPAAVDGSPVTIGCGDDWPADALRQAHAATAGELLLRLDHASLGGLTEARALALAADGACSVHIYPEHHRHLAHAGLARPYVDVFRPVPALDFVDRFVAGGQPAGPGRSLRPPAVAGPVAVLDHDVLGAHATWSARWDTDGRMDLESVGSSNNP